jgi:hypothetical protein
MALDVMMGGLFFVGILPHHRCGAKPPWRLSERPLEK